MSEKTLSLDGDMTSITAHTISKEKIFIDNSQQIYSNKWEIITEHLNKIKNPRLHCFAEDITYIDKNTSEQRFVYNYYALDYATVYELSKHKHFHIYETYESNQKIKLFLDIDIPIEKVPDKYKTKKDIYLNFIIDDIIELINDNIYKYNDTIIPKIIILKSCSENKLSSHIIYQNVIFNDIYHMRYFISNIKSNFTDNKILDPNVYRKGCFRLLWNSKIKKNINLEYDKSINYIYSDDKTLFDDCLLKNIPNDSYCLELNIPKSLSVKKITKTVQNKLVLQKKINNLYSIDYIKRYIDILDTKRKEDYKEWLDICIIVINCNSTKDGFELWHNWSKNSSKYINEQDCINQWNIMTKRKYNYGIGTLKYYAKFDNPEKYLDIESSNDLPIFESIKFNSLFLLNAIDEKLVNNDINIVCKNIINWYNSDIKTLCIKSCYNSGKTQILCKIFQELQFKRILFISYRQSLTNDIYGNFKEYKFKSYLDKIYDSNRIICQIESLYKLENDTYYTINIPEYDLVIMDESESLLNHFRSVTIQEKEKTFDFMKNIIFNSKKLLMLDGDFSNRSYTYGEYFGKSIILENECKKDKKHIIYTNERKYFEHMIDKDLKDGLNIVICSMSSKIATYFNNLYKDIYKTILHCSSSDDELKEKLKDVLNFWKRFQLLIYSPSIESGVNFNLDHFDKIYIILSTNSTSQRGLMQMMGRIRKLNDDNILVYLNNIPFSNKISFYKYDEIKNYLIETNKIEMKMVFDPKLKKMIKTYDFDLYNKILCYNIQEEANKNKNIFIGYLNYLLTNKGYTYECLDCKLNRNNIVKENILLDEILSSRDITGEELQKLLFKQSNNKATHEDKIVIERYMTINNLKLNNNKIILDLKEDDKLNEINNIIKKYYGKISQLDNLRQLKNINKLENTNYENNAINKKNQIINQIITKLGYADISDKKLIDRETFEINMNIIIKECELFTNPHIINPLFGLNKKNNFVKSLKSFLGFINSIFEEYGFNIKVKQKSIWLNNQKENINYYRINFVNDIDKFV